ADVQRNFEASRSSIPSRPASPSVPRVSLVIVQVPSRLSTRSSTVRPSTSPLREVVYSAWNGAIGAVRSAADAAAARLANSAKDAKGRNLTRNSEAGDRTVSACGPEPCRKQRPSATAADGIGVARRKSSPATGYLALAGTAHGRGSPKSRRRGPGPFLQEAGQGLVQAQWRGERRTVQHDPVAGQRDASLGDACHARDEQVVLLFEQSPGQ